MVSVVLTVLLVAALVALCLLWRRQTDLTERAGTLETQVRDVNARNRDLKLRYAPIIDAHAEIERAQKEAAQLRSSVKAEMEQLRSDTMAELTKLKAEKSSLSEEYGAARALYNRLRQQLALIEENVEDISVGLYKPHFDFDSSAKYQEVLSEIRERQKTLVRQGQATVCGTSWQVHGDAKAGERMTKQYLKLMLRAFNAECDAAVAKVTWNNVLKMEERIKAAHSALNEFGQVMQMSITPEYLDAKLDELRLEFETDQKKQEEKEEQRRIREQMREEERALREAERARKEAEEEEARNLKALEKARTELAQARGEALEQLQLKIQHLDAALHKSQELKEKATSMAQLTRSGHVYVISNVGSFGENVYKIGMTRRLDPMDRIWELGDASVPFDFDVHALIYCEDAPSVEGAFQTSFRDKAVNLVNQRKEFFAVSLEEIEAVARERNVKVELTKLAEAREYRETCAMRRAGLAGEKPPVPVEEEFPATV
jgi:hypothetical protein